MISAMGGALEVLDKIRSYRKLPSAQFAVLGRVKELDVATVPANVNFANHFVQKQRGRIAFMNLF